MADAVRRLRLAAETAGFRLLVGAVRALPRKRAVALGAGVGRFAFDRLGIRRAVAVRNVTERVGPPSAEAATVIARTSYQVMGRTFVDLLRGDRMTEQETWALVQRESFRPIVDIHAEGRGGILVSGHFGNWELIPIAVQRLGIPVAAMAGDQANPAVDQALRDLRSRAGITPLSSRSGLRDAVRWIRRGGLIATLMDQDAGRKGVFADFLGTPASTHTGVLSLAARTGAPVITGVSVEREGGYELRLGPVLRFPTEDASTDDLRHAAVVFNRWLEAEVRKAPGQYFWAHRRWKTRPPERADQEPAE